MFAPSLECHIVEMTKEKMELPPWPHYAEDEIDAATAVLRTGKVNYWTGSDVKAFEEAYAAYCGVDHAIALANGTLALEAGLIGLGLQAGDEVIVTSRTFIASASAIALRGGIPVFADVNRDSQNMDPTAVAAMIGPRTVGMVAVHLAGWPCDMDALGELADRHGLWIMEDCAQAHGAQWRGKPVGSFGHAAAFSFCQDKILSTGGEGGMLLTSDPGVYRRAWSFKDHGKSQEAVRTARQSSKPGFRWLHESLGTNWRLTGPQAAIGRVQLGKLDDWRITRNRHADVLRGCLQGLDAVRIPRPSEGVLHAYYKFYAFICPEAVRPGACRDDLLIAASEYGLPLMSGSCSEVYLEKAFEEAGLQPAERLPVARELGATSLMLPVHPTLREEQVEEIGELLAELVRGIQA